MLKLKNKLLATYRTITRSIAFLPTLIAVGGLIVASVLLYFRDALIVLEGQSYLSLHNADTARTLLSTLLAGLFSLMVFSFSMVMIILNQASTSFSPRLLPGLIANKRHQMVLGFYLGTITYSLTYLLSIRPESDAYQMSGVGVLLAAVLGVFCLGLFVYFIHSISQEIQINHILRRIFRQTQQNILAWQEDERVYQKPPNTDTWQNLYSTQSGYFVGISEQSIRSLCQAQECILQILPRRGDFILKNTPVIKSNQSLDESVIPDILSCILLSDTDDIKDNYVMGIRQITEIAVKAMSPGINDPGTAINAVDYLTDLLSLLSSSYEPNQLLNKKDEAVVYYEIHTFRNLLQESIASLRQYCKHDPNLMLHLIQMLQHLHRQAQSNSKQMKAIEAEIKALCADAKANLNNTYDYERFAQAATPFV